MTRMIGKNEFEARLQKRLKEQHERFLEDAFDSLLEIILDNYNWKEDVAIYETDKRKDITGQLAKVRILKTYVELRNLSNEKNKLATVTKNNIQQELKNIINYEIELSRKGRYHKINDLLSFNKNGKKFTLKLDLFDVHFNFTSVKYKLKIVLKENNIDKELLEKLNKYAELLNTYNLQKLAAYNFNYTLMKIKDKNRSSIDMRDNINQSSISFLKFEDEELEA